MENTKSPLQTDSAFHSTVDLSYIRFTGQNSVPMQASLETNTTTHSIGRMNDMESSPESSDSPLLVSIPDATHDFARLKQKASHLTTLVRDLVLENTPLRTHSGIHSITHPPVLDKSSKVKLTSSRITHLAEALGRDRWSKPNASTVNGLESQVYKMCAENEKLSARMMHVRTGSLEQRWFTPVPSIYLVLMMALCVQLVVIAAIMSS